MNMDARIERNRRFLADLFAGPFRGHAIIADPELPPALDSGDILTTALPISQWIDRELENYERRVRISDALGDDAVPHLRPFTGTEIFAAAFGCPIHTYADSLPAARPLVRTPAEADRVAEPSLAHPLFERWFTYAERLLERAGPGVPVAVPDIQSPFDIAALIWNKQDMYLAVYDAPDAVKRLVDKCSRVLTAFLREFLQRFPSGNLCHCPYAWAPREQGIWLSEDEAGALSVAAFEEFCLSSLVDLSRDFGGLFMHCCATADHQYGNFLRIPNLRGINRVFQAPGPRPAIEAFAGRAVLIMAGLDEQAIHDMLDMALPGTRFLFDLPAKPLYEQKAIYDRLRERCPAID